MADMHSNESCAILVAALERLNKCTKNLSVHFASCEALLEECGLIEY